MKKILVVGGASRHMQRWTRYVSPELYQDGILVDLFCISNKEVTFQGIRELYTFSNYSRLLSKIPVLRGLFINKNRVKDLKSVLLHEQYDLINIHQPAAWMLPFVRFAKRKGCKIVVTPWGSEVLRCSKSQKKRLSLLFNEVDNITCGIKGFSEQLLSLYDFNPSKIINVGFGSEIFDLIPLMKRFVNKDKYAKDLGIMPGGYYIACGYTAQRAQRHINMIDALGQNKEFIPENSVLLFQFTYGNNTDVDYKDELEKSCENYGLKYQFLTSYLSNEDMAKFRLICDLFIHLQPTDAGNASLQEFLLAGTQCVNGKWLKYPMLEKDGYPYHLCDTLDDLPSVVHSFFTGSLPKLYISKETELLILSGSWSHQKDVWRETFSFMLHE